MKFSARLLGILCLVLLVGTSLSPQKPSDMAGTWLGAATLDTESAANELTLILEIKEGKLIGAMSDQ